MPSIRPACAGRTWEYLSAPDRKIFLFDALFLSALHDLLHKAVHGGCCLALFLPCGVGVSVGRAPLLEGGIYLLIVQNVHNFVCRLGRIYMVSGIIRQQSLAYRGFQGVVECGVDAVAMDGGCR